MPPTSRAIILHPLYSPEPSTGSMAMGHNNRRGAENAEDGVEPNPSGAKKIPRLRRGAGRRGPVVRADPSRNCPRIAGGSPGPVSRPGQGGRRGSGNAQPG